MMVAMVVRMTSGTSPQRGTCRKNGSAGRGRVAQHERALAEVVQRQRRQHQVEPGALDGRAAEMAHVGIERFGAR